MNWDRIEGNWKQAKGKIKEHASAACNFSISLMKGTP